MLDGINYWDELKDSPSQMETCFAIFANVLELDDHGEPINEKYAERRAATFLYQYCRGKLHPGEADLEPWECELYRPSVRALLNALTHDAPHPANCESSAWPHSQFRLRTGRAAPHTPALSVQVGQPKWLPVAMVAGVLFEPVIEEFQFVHQEDRLVGDLVLPPWPGPHPVVVFVEGSGPGGRDQGSWPTRLAAAGLASVAYDKPGSGASTGDWTHQTLTDRAAETTAAVAALRNRDDVLTGAVALLGGSQGGWVAQLAASLADTVAAAVTVSGPGVSVLAQEEYRLNNQLPAEGFTSEDVELALALLHEQVDRVAAGEDPAVVHAAQASWQDTAWYPLLAGTTPQTIAFLAGIANYDPTPALARLNCPLLAIFGADDLLVPVDESVRIIATALAESGHEDHQIVVFPHADHSIRVFTGEGQPRVKYGHYMPGEPAPGYAELVVTWLQRRLTR